MKGRRDWVGVVAAAGSMTALGGAFAVTGLITEYPVYAGQALRYGVAAMALAGLVSWQRRPWLVPGRRELLLLVALAATGLVGFNVALIEGVRITEPATLGTIVGASPVLLALLGPIIEGRSPSRRILPAALLCATGAALVYGATPTSWQALALALLTLCCECAFSLLAVPLLARLGPLLVSTYVTALAAVSLAAIAWAQRPHEPFPTPSLSEAAALAYLALVVTAVAFLAWYTAVGRLGVDRAGLFGALVPVTTLLLAAALGTGTIQPANAAGVALVALGLLGSLTRRTPPSTELPPPSVEVTPPRQETSGGAAGPA